MVNGKVDVEPKKKKKERTKERKLGTTVIYCRNVGTRVIKTFCVIITIKHVFFLLNGRTFYSLTTTKIIKKALIYF